MLKERARGELKKEGEGVGDKVKVGRAKIFREEWLSSSCSSIYNVGLWEKKMFFLGLGLTKDFFFFYVVLPPGGSMRSLKM